jgi:ABC-type multidrug transport system fused ATPase/permease subunit
VQPLLILAEVLEKRRQVQCAVDLAQRRGSEKTVPKWGLWEYDGNIVETMMMMMMIMMMMMMIVVIIVIVIVIITIIIIINIIIIAIIVFIYNNNKYYYIQQYIYINNMHPQLLDIMV